LKLGVDLDRVVDMYLNVRFKPSASSSSYGDNIGPGQQLPL
jgi:hypothetical protein